MRLIGLTLWLGSLLLGTPPVWSGGPPTQQVLKVLPNGEWWLIAQMAKPICEMKEYTYTVQVPYTVTKQRVVEGVTEDYTVTVYKPEQRTATRTVCRTVTESTCRPIDPKTVKAFETDGQTIAADKVAQRCRQETLVVVSSDAEMVPAYYAVLFQPGTIFLAIAAPPPAVDPPAPVPPTAPAPVPVLDNPAPVATPPAPSAASARPLVHRVSHSTTEFRNAATLPSLPAPEFVFLGREGADELKVRQYSEVHDDTDVTCKISDSSISPEQTIKARRTTRHNVYTFLPWKSVRISVPESGGDVLQNLVLERLGSGEIAGLLSTDGALVDAFWLQNIKPGAFIVRGARLPAVTPGCAAVPAMPCAPMPMTAPHAAPAEALEAPSAPAPPSA